ncbi:MAG: hypothetical protein JO030_02725 [Candidatus Eremiobacteraeota bacterium]|nr:hypothetical protein [Candidatus Eremiobacteraeota bacterium]
MIAPLPAVRNERIAAARGIPCAPRGASSDVGADLTTEQQQELAAQHQAFDYDAAERAEILREHEVIQAILMAHLKNEDEITKKWISLI